LGRFLLKRLVNYLVLVIVATTLAYLVASLALNPRSAYEGRNPPPPAAVVDQQLSAYGVNDKDPLLGRYADWIGGVLLHGDFGKTVTGGDMAKAIDRQTIADALLGPLGGDATKLDNHIFMTNQEGYQDNSGDLSKADVAAANSQLEAAGWTREGDATRTKDGQNLVIRFVIPSGVASSQQEAELVQGMLAQVGAEVDIQTVPVGDFFESYVNTGDFDFTVFSWIGTPFPISSNSSIYEEPKGDEIQQNYARVGSADLDALFQQAAEELDPAKARDIGNEIDTKIWDEVHSLTLYQRPDLIAANTKLANFGAFGFASVKYQDIGFTK